MSYRRALLAAACLFLAAAALSACGASSPVAARHPQALAKDAVSALADAHSTHISGDLSSGQSGVALDLWMFANGSSAGTFGPSKAPARMVIVSGTVYFDGPAAFWEVLGSSSTETMPTADASRLADRWISLPSSSSESFATFTLPGLAESIGSGQNKFKAIGSRVVHKKATYGLQSVKKGALWVAKSGKHYPVEITEKSGSGKEEIFFSDWDEGTAPSAPAGAKSLSSVLKKAG